MQVAQRRHPMLRKFICRSANVARRASYQLVAGPQLQAGLYLPVFKRRGREIPRGCGLPGAAGA